jgi:UDP-2,3-diacylglucosamine pyrophosphatase LpxH
MAYIVVSDVHLGSEKCNQAEFCNFLDWVHGLDSQPKIIECKDDKEVTIKKPEKIVLIGDILELWDPEDGNRDYVIRDGMRPFSILSQLNCEKVYVVGNHDDSLSELEDYIDYVILPNGTKFNIYDRHYPKKDEKGMASGETIGNQSYFFLHGHQFDKEQDILAKVSDILGERWDPLGWFQSLFNITFTKKHWMVNLVAFLLLFLVGRSVLDKLLIPNFLFQMNVLLFIILIVMLYIVGRYLWNYYLKSSFLTNLVWVALVILGIYFGWQYYESNQPSQFVYIVIWAALTGFFAFSSIPGVVAKSQGLIYSLTKPIDKTAEQVIKDEYYQKKKDTIKADVVVFGHTHFASYYGPDKDTGNKLFINSGNWTGKDSVINGKQRYVNTFVYIDEGGAYLLRWRGCDKIECIEAFPEGKSVVTEPAI